MHGAILSQLTIDYARQLGFDLAAIVRASAPGTTSHYRAWIERGYHGEMAYLARRDALERRVDLELTLHEVRSVITVAANYHSAPLPHELQADPARGIIASYAVGGDYHRVLEQRLRHLGVFVAREAGRPVTFKAYVDTGPLLERDIAVQGGLGFVGKNTNLIHPGLGSWLLLGEVLLTIDLPPSPTSAVTVPPRCGHCTRCLDACPTQALIAPYLLDARRCISYLTIELKGLIPRELRRPMGNRIFGCDICQQVCPWNRCFARPSEDPLFQPRAANRAPRLLDLIALDDAAFARRFSGSPVRRARHRGFLRNVIVALGNWGDPAAVDPLSWALGHAEALVRGHAAWALGQIRSAYARQALRQALAAETDPWVRQELEEALG